MTIRFYTLCIALLVATNALARPVSYPGGTTFMLMNDMDSNNLHLHYSPSIRYSIGYKAEYWRQDEWQFHGVQLNNLLKRWNKPASQANIYLKSGLGLTRSKEGETDLGAFTGLAMDWENRRFFTSYQNRVYHAGDIDQFFTQRARVGIAPYIGDYGDLHTWLMLQVDHMPEQQDAVVITPVIRLFKNEYLTEIGVSDNGDALVNLIIRF